MQIRRLIAVDEPKTVCREDAFLLERSKDGAVKRLTVACVIPPKDIRINYSAFLRNIFRRRGEQPEYFLSAKDRLNLGLSSSETQKVLMAIFEFDEHDNFIIKIATGFAIIKATTYEEFSSQEDFNDIKTGIEHFLFQNNNIHWKYETGYGEQHWETEASPSRRLIASMQKMFNDAVSLYAYKQKLRTFKLRDSSLKFRIHEGASFRSPLRRALSFVNILNVVATIDEEDLPYPWERLQQLLGKGYPIST